MSWALPATQILLIVSLALGFYRMVKGPRTLNRILALDYICGCIVGLIAIHSIQKVTVDYLEMIVIFSLLGFATVISLMEMHFAMAKEKSHD